MDFSVVVEFMGEVLFLRKYSQNPSRLVTGICHICHHRVIFRNLGSYLVFSYMNAKLTFENYY